MPDDWHVMKTATEVIKHVLADVGFKVFASKCGHKGDTSQWQDLHNVIIASLCRLSVEEFNKSDNEKEYNKFWKWIACICRVA